VAGDERGGGAWLAEQLGEHDPDTALLMLWTARLGQLNGLLLEQQARSRGRTAAEDRLLVSLLVMGPPHRLSPTRLREMLVQSSGGMTKTLARLEAAGLVVRTPDPADGRGVLAELTPAGRAAAEEALAGHVERYESLLDGLDAGARDELLRSVRSLLDALERQLEARPSGVIGAPLP
jgi:DNA-binding MarR family transcriptional regulator